MDSGSSGEFPYPPQQIYESDEYDLTSSIPPSPTMMTPDLDDLMDIIQITPDSDQDAGGSRRARMGDRSESEDEDEDLLASTGWIRTHVSPWKYDTAADDEELAFLESVVAPRMKAFKIMPSSREAVSVVILYHQPLVPVTVYTFRTEFLESCRVMPDFEKHRGKPFTVSDLITLLLAKGLEYSGRQKFISAWEEWLATEDALRANLVNAVDCLDEQSMQPLGNGSVLIQIFSE